MLLAAAAERWAVGASTLRTENGRVLHDASQRVANYGELVELAAKQTVPREPKLKDARVFRLIGTSPPQLDAPDKVTGRAAYGIDARVPGMLFATVVHPPVFGSTVKSFDASKAKAVPGVKHVVQVSQGVAVVAEHTGAAFKGALALSITYDNTAFSMSSAGIFKTFAELAEQPGAEARRLGDVAAGLASSSKRVQATYQEIGRASCRERVTPRV